MVRCEPNTCAASGSIKPLWLAVLLAERFFAACEKHDCVKKNEKNVFCLDCMTSICQHCISDHKLHHLLQIRRYVYHDVIRLHDIQKLLDCSRVQAYTINGARVVFLKERPQPKSSKGLSGNCEVCERSLQDAYKFCSIACKVDMAFNVGQGKEGHDTSTTTHKKHTNIDHTRTNKNTITRRPSSYARMQQDETVASEGQLDSELTASTVSCESIDTINLGSSPYYSKFCVVSAHTPRRPRYVHPCHPATLKLSSLLLKRVAGPCSASLIIPAHLRRRKCSKPLRSPFS